MYFLVKFNRHQRCLFVFFYSGMSRNFKKHSVDLYPIFVYIYISCNKIRIPFRIPLSQQDIIFKKKIEMEENPFLIYHLICMCMCITIRSLSLCFPELYCCQFEMLDAFSHQEAKLSNSQADFKFFLNFNYWTPQNYQQCQMSIYYPFSLCILSCRVDTTFYTEIFKRNKDLNSDRNDELSTT